jgi:hypothetical protein
VALTAIATLLISGPAAPAASFEDGTEGWAPGSYELRTNAAGTSTSIAVQTGPEFTWCQSNFGFVNAGTTTTVTADLADAMPCDPSTLTDIRAAWVFVSGGGDFDLD